VYTRKDRNEVTVLNKKVYSQTEEFPDFVEEFETLPEQKETEVLLHNHFIVHS